MWALFLTRLDDGSLPFNGNPSNFWDEYGPGNDFIADILTIIVFVLGTNWDEVTDTLSLEGSSPIVLILFWLLWWIEDDGYLYLSSVLNDCLDTLPFTEFIFESKIRIW